MDSEQHLRKAQAELVSTEETYVDQLRKLCFGQEFLSRHCDNSLQDSIAVVFQHVPTLLELHQELLRKLKLNPEHPHEGLLEAVDFLKLTQNYAKAFPQASSTFQRLCEGKKFRAFVANLELETNGLTFGSLLITPIQRLPRYRLLMGEILKHTPASSPDRLTVEELYGKVCEVATSVNENVKQAEAVAKFGEELASLKMNRFRHLLSSESQPIRSALIEGRTNEGNFKPRRLIMFSDVLVLTNSKFVCRAAFRLADITFYHEDPNTMNSLFIEAGNYELTAQFSTSTERDEWAAEISQRTVSIKQKELEKLVRASSSLTSPNGCLAHPPPPKKPLRRRPLHDATNTRPSPPLKRTLSYSLTSSSSHGQADAPSPHERPVSSQSNLMPSRFLSLANEKAQERKPRQERGDPSPFSTPSKSVALEAARYGAGTSFQMQSLSNKSSTRSTATLISPAQSSNRQDATSSKSSACIKTPFVTSSKFRPMRKISREPPKLSRRLQSTPLCRRNLHLSSGVSSGAPEDVRSSSKSNIIKSRQNRPEESPQSSDSETDFSSSPLDSHQSLDESDLMSDGSPFDLSGLSNALDEFSAGVNQMRSPSPTVSPMPKADLCPQPSKPTEDFSTRDDASRRIDLTADTLSQSSEDAWEPIPGQLLDHDALALSSMREGEASPVEQNEVLRECVPESPASDENFYRAIYFSPQRQEEVAKVLRDLPRGDNGPKNLPVYFANRLKPNREEESCFTEEKFGMELRISSVKAFLEDRGMPSEIQDVEAFIQCRKLDLVTFWIEETCFEQMVAILPSCRCEREIAVDLLSKVQYDVESALHYLLEDGRFA